MKTITKTFTTYAFDELSDKAKEDALHELYDINVDYDWWQFVYEDAETIGLKISEFDIDRGSYCKGRLTDGLLASIETIMTNHGEGTDTYKLAVTYKEKTNKLGLEDVDGDMLDELASEYTTDLCEIYLGMLRGEYEYLMSSEAIVESINANDYQFTEEGKIFNQPLTMLIKRVKGKRR